MESSLLLFDQGVSDKLEFNKLTKDSYPKDLSLAVLVFSYLNAAVLKLFEYESSIFHQTHSLPH